MKKNAIIIILLLFLFCPKADAELGSFGLIVEGGKEELVMQKGEQEWLYVQSGLSGLPRFKDLTFFSDNTIVATVGLHTGIVTANSYGTAIISVTDDAGENGTIKIKVTGNREKPSLFILLIMALPLLFLLLIIIKK